MANTISISPKPGIKCFPEYIKIYDILVRDTAQETQELARKSTKKQWLRTGEPANCICTHHVDRHCTATGDRYGHVVTIYCNGNGESCNCGLFRTRSMRIVTEEEDI
jgi:hypothetical protein